MEVRFLLAKAVEAEIIKLVEQHDELHWAVAWGTMHGAAKKALAQKRKFAAVTFGLAFAHTDPDLVDALVGVKGARLVTKFPGGTFHPKIYAFKSGEHVSAIIGSANFTPGGLGANSEAAVLLIGTTHDRALSDILKYCADSARMGEPVSVELAKRYALSCKSIGRIPRPPKDPLSTVPTGMVRGLTSRLANMSWQEYVAAVKNSDHHDPADSLELLRTAQSWFAAKRSFRDFSTSQRKAIAGVLGERERQSDPELDRDWGWFGSMSGAGEFAKLVGANSPLLAKAIDGIPLRGEVTRAHYNRFLQIFTEAFSGATRRGGVPTASRLLALKRPDVFLCVCEPNRAQAAAQLGFAKTGLRLENYWELVVEVVRTSGWYNAEKPEGRLGQLWESRVAMLDTVLYRPAPATAP